MRRRQGSRAFRRWIVLPVLVATLAIAGTAPALASVPDWNGYHWNASWGGWIDNDCALLGQAPYYFKVDVANGPLGTQAKTRICSQARDLRNVPRGLDGNQPKGNFDNKITSIRTFDDAFCDGDGWLLLYHGVAYTGTLRVITPTPPDTWENLKTVDQDVVSSLDAEDCV